MNSPAKSELECLREVAQAARELESFLHQNTGRNADWPIQMKVDDTQVAITLTEAFNALTKALKELKETNELRKSNPGN